MTDYLHMADLCSTEINRLRRLRATYLRAHREQQAQRSRGLEQLDLTTTTPLERIRAHARAHDPQPPFDTLSTEVLDDAPGIVAPPGAWYLPCPVAICTAFLTADTSEHLAQARDTHLAEAHARR
jgi:hypothetical protein